MEYHNELYGYIQSKAIEANEKNEREGAFDNWLVSKKNSIKIMDKGEELC